MGKQFGRIIMAIFLILVGVVALLSNLNMLPFDINNNQTFWLAAFGLGGLAFTAVFLSDARENWWAVIPGFTLIGLGLLIGFEPIWNDLGAAVFMGMIGLSFWVIFLTERKERWWAIIPAGVLTSLAGVIAVSSGPDGGVLAGSVLFFGIALTFLVVYAVLRQSWALWPAGILAILGALVLTGAGGAAAFVWPVLLILGGGWLILRSMRTRIG